MTRFRVSLVSAILVAVMAIGLALTHRSLAQSIPGNRFGGRITDVYYCCNGLAIIVGPPSAGWYLFTGGSILKAHYNIYGPGPWVLGYARPGGTCLVKEALCLGTLPMQGTILQVGTSAL
jgi:hypothetical protein